MTPNYGLTIGVPLVLSLAVLALATGTLLMRGRQRPAPGGPRQGAPPGAAWTGSQLLVTGLLLTGVFLAANHHLVRGVAIGRFDADGQFFPYYVLVADHARAATVVQWDPWSNGGLPAMADPQVGAFSPLSVILGLITGGSSAGFRMYWLLVWWIGGLGMLMLGGHLGAPTWGAGAVALGFLFCGVYTGNAEHTSWIFAFSLLPPIIWRLDVALCSRRLQPAVEAGALWGFSALAGYPGVVVITGGFAAAWAAGRWLIAHDPTLPVVGSPGTRAARGPTFGSVVVALGCVLVVGLLVLSPTYFAFFFEGAGVNQRVGSLPREIALSNALEPGALATFASPYLAALKVARQFMDPAIAPGRLWPGTDLSMVSVYLGGIVPMLALFALLSRPRDGWRWWITALGVLSLGCAMADTLPLRGWLYDSVYPTRFFRHAAIFRLPAVFALCVLAMVGARDVGKGLEQGDRQLFRRLLIAAAVVAVAAALSFVPFLDPAWSYGMPPAAVALGRVHFAWIWIGVVALAYIAWRASPPWRGRSVPVLLVALAASDALVTNVLSIPSMVRIGDAAARWTDLDARHRANLSLTANGWWRADRACQVPATERCLRNDQLVLKIPVFEAYTTEKNPFHQSMAQQPLLRGMATGADRIWFSTHVAHVSPTEGAFLALRRRAEQLGAPPLVVHAAAELLGSTRADADVDRVRDATAIEQLPAARRIQADVVRYVPQELVFDVHPPSDGWVLVTDRWARSWRVEVNGRPATLYGGNFIFRAIPVSAGASRITLTYRPAGLPWLLAVSWGTLGLVTVAATPLRYGFRIRRTRR